MRGKWILVAGVVLIAAVGAGGWWYWKSTAPVKPEVTTQAPVDLPAGAEITLQATLRVQHVVEVKAPVDGVLEEFPVAPNDEVFEGQILGRVANDTLQENERNSVHELERLQSRVHALESTLVAARLEESRASADAARARSEEQAAERVYQRQSMLWREGATPRRAYESADQAYSAAKSEAGTLTALAREIADRVKQAVADLDAAKKTYADAEAQATAARDALAASEILSPVDGLILSIRKQAGEEVRKDAEPLIEIGVDLTAMEAVMEPDPRTLKRLKTGLPALIVIAELPGDGVPGTLTEIDDTRAVVEFASPSPLIRPGVTVSVRLKLP